SMTSITAMLSESALYAAPADAERALGVVGTFLDCVAVHLPGHTERKSLGGEPATYVTYHYLTVTRPHYPVLEADDSLAFAFDAPETYRGKTHPYDGAVVYLRRGRALIQLLVVAPSAARRASLAHSLVATLDARAAAALG